MKARRGFTLVELLVAVFITALLFAMAYGAINQAVANRAAIEQTQDRALAVQRAIRTLVQDFSQLAPRPVRQPLGDGYLPAISSVSQPPNLVVFTRGGWPNPAGVQRSALQRLRYHFEDGKLSRDYWPVLDATLDPPPRNETLLEGVRSVRIRYMDAARNWQEQWPFNGNPSGLSPLDLRIRPVAVEVTIELEDWGRISRLIEVPG
ncbi:MAG: hypothetical protein RLZZ393_2162 [Pseudomonadota bacterium]